jgi:hypothetical protein
MNFSIAPIATGSLRAFKMHDPSQSRSCGQTREQISGMLLVVREIAAASKNLPSAVNNNHSGIRFRSGQPSMQRGFGQLKHRHACSRTVCSSNNS